MSRGNDDSEIVSSVETQVFEKVARAKLHFHIRVVMMFSIAY